MAVDTQAKRMSALGGLLPLPAAGGGAITTPDRQQLLDLYRLAAEPGSTLNDRQTICYTDVCDVWQKLETVDADGFPAGEQYACIARGLSYFHKTTPNFAQTSDAGAIIEANILTADVGHFAVGDNIPDHGLIKNVTPGSAFFGLWYTILSTAQFFPVRGNRNANSQLHPLRWNEVPPAGLI